MKKIFKILLYLILFVIITSIVGYITYKKSDLVRKFVNEKLNISPREDILDNIEDNQSNNKNDYDNENSFDWGEYVIDESVPEDEVVKEFFVNGKTFFLFTGKQFENTTKGYGLRHILCRHSEDYFKDFDYKENIALFPANTNVEQIIDGIEEVLKYGRVSEPDKSENYTVEYKIFMNNEEVDYKVVIRKSDNSIVTFFKIVIQPQNGVYTDGNIYLIIYDYEKGSENFESVLVNISNNLVKDGLDVQYINSVWKSEEIYNSFNQNSKECEIDIKFTEANKLIISSKNNCYKLNSTLTKVSNNSKPVKGTYNYTTTKTNADFVISDVSSDYTEIGFNIIVGSENGCTGEITEYESYEYAYGYDGFYVFTDNENCSLFINFKNNTAIVTELNCNLHGENCSFEGIYKK